MAANLPTASALRFALKHLYDANALRRCAFLKGLGLAEQPGGPATLQQFLTDAIAELEPLDQVSTHSPMRRIYEILFYRFVQQCSQQEVAGQLGVGIRHLRREEVAAIEFLAQRLVARVVAAPSCPIEEPREPYDNSLENSTVTQELTWLRNLPPDKPVQIADALATTLGLVRPLANQHSARLESGSLRGLPAVAVHPVALRQILLSLLTIAIRQAPQRVCVTAAPRGSVVGVAIRARGALRVPEPIPSGDPALEITRCLIAACGGSLVVQPDKEGFAATVTLPALKKLPILIIDDNPDTIRLLERYASGTRYRVVGAETQTQAFARCREALPSIIVLDVMMPDMDGWELLGHLRQHPLTVNTPVIVCSILAERELALSLGASDFLRKPISRDAFLDALDRQVAASEPGARIPHGYSPADPPS